MKCTYHCHVNEKVLEESPHVIARVDFLHLHLCVDVTMIQEVHVRVLNLHKICSFLKKDIWAGALHHCSNISVSSSANGWGIFLTFCRKIEEGCDVTMMTLTSGRQSGWDVTRTMSSSGSSEWHLISVYTFLPSVQHASSVTRLMWYLFRRSAIPSIHNAKYSGPGDAIYNWVVRQVQLAVGSAFSLGQNSSAHPKSDICGFTGSYSPSRVDPILRPIPQEGLGFLRGRSKWADSGLLFRSSWVIQAPMGQPAWVGCEGPCGVARSASDPLTAGMTSCRCRREARPRPRSPTATRRVNIVSH